MTRSTNRIYRVVGLSNTLTDAWLRLRPLSLGLKHLVQGILRDKNPLPNSNVRHFPIADCRVHVVLGKRVSLLRSPYLGRQVLTSLGDAHDPSLPKVCVAFMGCDEPIQVRC